MFPQQKAELLLSCPSRLQMSVVVRYDLSPARPFRSFDCQILMSHPEMVTPGYIP